MIVRGDLPYYFANSSKNIIGERLFSAWLPFDSLGKTTTLSLDTLQSLAFSVFAFGKTGVLHFYINYLPILLAGIVVYFLSVKLFANRATALVLVLFYLANPVIFGDFRSGQTMWIYALLPLVYFLVFTFLSNIESKSFAVVLAFTIFSAVSVLPPMLVPLVLFIVISAVFAAVRDNKMRSASILRTLFIRVMLVGLVLSVLLAPLLYSASSGKEALTRSSVVPDFINNYALTSPENVLRLAGNQGNGQKSLGYNQSSFTNSFGYIIPILIVTGLYFASSRRKKGELQHREKALQFTLLYIPAVLVVFSFFVVTYFYKEVGINFFTSSWLAATIRNPTKIFVLILFPVTIAIGLGLQGIVDLIPRDKKLSILYKQLLIAISAVCILVYGWPILRGDMGLFYGRDEDHSIFNPSSTVRAISENENLLTDQRAVLIPTTHLDELNFQSTVRALNALRGGGLENTTVFQDKIKELYKDQDLLFAELVRVAGLDRIFLSKNASQDASYAPFPTTVDPSDAEIYLTRIFSIKDKRELYTSYEVSDSDDLLYTAKDSFTLPKYDIEEMIALHRGKHTAVVEPLDASSFSDKSINYMRHSEPQKGANNTALLYSNKLVRVGISSTVLGDTRKVKIQQIDPFSIFVGTPAYFTVNASDKYLYWVNRFIDLNTEYQEINVRSGANTLSFFSQNSPVKKDLTIDSKGDASKGSPGQPDIDISISNKELGKELRLYAGNHTAYAVKNFEVKNVSKTDKGVIELSYRTSNGQGPSYAIIHKNSGNYVKRGVLPAHSTRTSEIISYPLDSAETGSYELYLYSIPQNATVSENIFSEINPGVVEASRSENVDISAYSHEYSITEAMKSPSLESEDMVTNSEFDSLVGWSNVGDASISIPGDFNIDAKITQTDKNNVLMLTAKRHSAYIAQDIAQYDPNAMYKISFKYKNISGAGPAVAVVQSGASTNIPIGDLKFTKGEWSTYSKTFMPDKDTTSLSIFLYSMASGVTTVNLYDDVKLEKLPVISKYLSSKDKSSIQNPEIIKGYKRISPTKLVVDITDKPGLVVFNESYHQGWRAYMVKGEAKQGILDFLLLKHPGKMIPIEQHMLVNSFANGWYISPQDQKDSTGYKLVIEYWPQRIYILTLALFTAMVLTCTSISVLVILKRIGTMERGRYIAKG